MEEVRKVKGKYYGLESGKVYEEGQYIDLMEVEGQKAAGCWHAHGYGMPVVKVGKADDDTRVDGEMKEEAAEGEDY